MNTVILSIMRVGFIHAIGYKFALALSDAAQDVQFTAPMAPKVPRTALSLLILKLQFREHGYPR